MWELRSLSSDFFRCLAWSDEQEDNFGDQKNDLTYECLPGKNDRNRGRWILCLLGCVEGRKERLIHVGEVYIASRRITAWRGRT